MSDILWFSRFVWDCIKNWLTRILLHGTATPYSPSSPTTNSSDTTSPVYPDRPIRPLPKRPLRSRLSPEVADSIRYPPAPASSSLFYSYSPSTHHLAGALVDSEAEEVNKALIGAPKACNGDAKNGYQFRGKELESDEEDGLGLIRRYENQQRRSLSVMPSRGYTNGVSRNHDPLSQSAVSSNESVDGYDSFENTNNKKKRKIPTGSLGSQHSSLSADMANMGISQGHDSEEFPVTPDLASNQYQGSPSSNTLYSIPGTGISGAGRGRYGRSGRREVSGRSPLGVSTNASNAWQLGRLTTRPDYTPMSSLPGKARNLPMDHGIISAAIAEAASIPSASPKGQENMSLLEQTATKKASSSKTQFTFTCESDTSKGMIWPGEHDHPLGSPYHAVSGSNVPGSQYNQNQKGFSTQGTQTSPTMAVQTNQNGVAPGSKANPTSQPPRKPRRPPGQRYAIAARERRFQQEYNNYHHPPGDEDIWICEFCEYESIFGSPPEALVRQYEIKDRRERKRLAEKRRLLEKAKMKGRKGKKGNKNTARSTSSAGATQAHQSTSQQNHQQQTDTTPVQSHGTQSDEYFGEDYDDNPASMKALPPQVPTKIPQPVTQHYGHSIRTAHNNGIANLRDDRIGGTA
ncbi:hypothetical protein MMC13_002708 [Lambiella insularis]|nr:hypothetical protein [Lambiella insularis]